MEQMRIEERVTEIKCRCKEKIIYCSRMFRFHSNYLTRKRTHLWPDAGCIHRQRPTNIV